MHYKLPNYLRAYRKRAGLTQTELAFLLGSANGSKISRLERRARTVNLETLIAHQIFSVSGEQLVPNMFETVEAGVLSQALYLSEKLKERNLVLP